MITFRAEYEPRYQQLKRHRDAANAETVFVYDYELDSAGAGVGDLVELRRPTITNPDGGVISAVERFEYTSRGQIARHVVADTENIYRYDGTGLQAGYLTETERSSPDFLSRERFERDDRGNITARINGEGGRTEYAIDAFNLVRSVTHADGRVHHFDYDGPARLVRWRQPCGDYADGVLTGLEIWHDFAYNPLGFLVSETLAANTADPRRTTFERNAEGQILRRIEPDGSELRWRYDERGSVLGEEVREADGTLLRRTLNVHDRVGRLERVLVEGGPELAMLYDGFGRLVRFVDPDGTAVRYRRDSRGLPVDIAVTGARDDPVPDPAGLLARQRIEYNEAGLPLRRIDEHFVDPSGARTDLVTSLTYDDGWRVVRRDLPSGLSVTAQYTAVGGIADQFDSLGNGITTGFDLSGRLTRITRREVATEGTLEVLTETIGYDSSGRVVTETGPDGQSVSYAYDGRGLLVQATNPVGEDMILGYDAHGEVASQSQGGSTIRWRRDANGRVIAITHPDGVETGFDRDALNRITGVRRADGARQSYSYHPDGGLARFTDFDGTRLDYLNTASGLPSRITATPAAGVIATAQTEIGYDGLRRITRATHAAVASGRRYDSLGRMVEETGPSPVVVDADPAGLSQRMTYPDGRRDLHEFDALGRLRAVSTEVAGSLVAETPAGAPHAQVSWRGNGRPDAVTFADGTRHSRTYDASGRLAGNRYEDAGGATLFGEELYRDRNGLIQAARREDASATAEAYSVDAQNRLTRVELGLPPDTLPPAAAVLDQAAQEAAIGSARAAAGAQTSINLVYTSSDTPAQRDETGPGGASSRLFATDAIGRLDSIDGAALSYDARGNVIAMPGLSLEYDAFRRLTSIDAGGGAVETFVYDGFGRCIRRSMGGVATEQSFFGDELIERRRGGALIEQYTPGLFLDQPLMMHGVTGGFVPLYEVTGSLAALAQGGAVAERFRYSPFGAATIHDPAGSPLTASTTGFEPRFHGRPLLGIGQVYDFRARCYAPVLMGFLQPDPFLFSGSWNPYNYSRFNPYNFTDPYGEFWNIVAGAVIGAAIGGIGAWLSGGDIGDILVGMGAGAAGGALTACGMPVLGGAVAGGIMGAWSGGRVGYELGGARGAVVGALGGGLIGAGLGAAGGGIGARVGNSVGTAVYGRVFNAAIARNMGSRIASTAARASSMVVGGYAGGASAGIFGNTTSSVVVDLATGGEITADQFVDGIGRGLIVDGPLGAVGAVGERAAMMARLPSQTGHPWRATGNTSRDNLRLGSNLGLEGETLVGKSLGIRPARNNESITVNGRTRRPDFPEAATDPHIVEVKNKTNLSTGTGRRRDTTQINDFADYARPNNGDVILYHRPGMDISPVAGISNIQTRPIPQQPMVVPIPYLIPERRRETEGSK